MLKKFLDGLCDLIYPVNCIICKKYLGEEKTKGNICRTCQDTIEFNKPPFCPNCSRYLKDTYEENLCLECQHTTYHFDRVWATTLYNDTMKKLIHSFKYKNRTSLRNNFTQIICSFLQDYSFDIANHNFIAPIPLHPTRLRERGYNQSQLIVDNISKIYRIETLSGNLVRIYNTKNQALLNKKDRWTNIKGAFKIRNPSKIRGKSVLIFDDLLTTGATVSEAARTLKESGAQKVNVLTLSIAC